MLFDDFAEISVGMWNRYFQWISDNINRVVSPSRIYFPVFALVSEYDSAYAIEIIGFQKTYAPLKVKKRTKCGDINSYFDLFNTTTHNPILLLDAFNNSFTGITFTNKISDREALLKRFPYIKLYNSGFVRPDGSGAAIAFGSAFESAYFECCAIVNRLEEVYRCKHILFLCVYSKRLTKVDIIKSYERIFCRIHQGDIGHISGVFFANENDHRLLVASHLQNLYLTDKVHETTIGEYMNRHPEILRFVFNTEEYIYEPYLPWIDRNKNTDDEAINPDLFVKRQDGYFDIIDFKLSALRRTSLTKGPRRRRRFVDYVYEGLAQLSNYADYFQFPQNCAFAHQKYGIQISSPHLTLVVGNSENVDYTEVAEALRAHSGLNCSIMDYDTLVSVYIKPE